MLEKVPGYSFSYSDHFGLEATLDVVTTIPEPENPEDIVDIGRQRPLVEVDSELATETIDTMVNALTTCYRYSQHRSKKELLSFAACLVLLIGAIVASVWINHGWINPIIIVATIFLAWLGTTLLYEGFIYGKWECNALMNVIEELDIHKRSLRFSAQQVT